MVTFKGTINGVEYTDRKEFFKALRSLDPKSRCRVNVVEEDVVENEEKSSEFKKPNEKSATANLNIDYKDLMGNLFDRIFGSFLKAENPSLDKKLSEPKKPANLKKLSKKQDQASFFDDILKKYFFPETTYIFKGNADDEWHLDRFSELLAKRANEIKNENLSNLDTEHLETLYHRSLEEYARISGEVGKIDKRLKEFDKSLAGIENLVNAYDNVGWTVPQNIQVLLSDTKSGFDQLINRKNYYLLLMEHYRNVGPYFDPPVND